MIVFVVGWNVAEGEQRSLQGALERAAARYPQLDPETRWQHRVGRTFAAGITWPAEALGPRRCVATSERELVLYDGFAVAPGGELTPTDATELARHWDRLTTLLEGQILLVRAAADGLEVVTDPLGMAPIYAREHRGGWLLSNNVELLASVGERPSFDALGVSTQLACDWVGGDRTLREGIVVVPGGTRWRFEADSSCPTRQRWFSVRALAITKPAPMATKDLARSLGDQITHAARVTPDLRCGLTGGRDSRMITALLLAAGLRARYFTTGEPTSADAEIAREIAAQLGLDHEVTPLSKADVLTHWDAASRRLVTQADGLVSLWQIADVVRQPSRAAGARLVLAGTGGEIGRGYYLHHMPDLLEASRARAASMLAGGVTQSGQGLLRDSAFRLARDHVEDFVAGALADGVPVPDVSDVFYTERTSRWAGNLVRRSMAVSSRYCLFASRVFVEAAFAKSPNERAAEVIHREILRELSPLLFEHRFDRGGWRAVDDPFVASPACPEPAFLQSAWLEALMPLLRPAILDASRSALWDFVDRPTFERISAEDSPPVERRRRAGQLYAIATLFLYERLFMGASPG